MRVAKSAAGFTSGIKIGGRVIDAGSGAVAVADGGAVADAEGGAEKVGKYDKFPLLSRTQRRPSTLCSENICGDDVARGLEGVFDVTSRVAGPLASAGTTGVSTPGSVFTTAVAGTMSLSSSSPLEMM